MKYSIPAKSVQYEHEIKKSRFIAHIKHVCDRTQAEHFINRLRKDHPQCNHVCWAYIAGPPNTTVLSMSDDGEPSGTAGRPILNALSHSGLGEIAVAVVRYFGGTKLGTGGLQRAYSNVVIEALKMLPTHEKIPLQIFSLQIAFAMESAIRHLLQSHQADIIDCIYQDSISINACVAVEKFEKLCTEINNATSGDALIKKR